MGLKSIKTKLSSIDWWDVAFWSFIFIMVTALIISVIWMIHMVYTEEIKPRFECRIICSDLDLEHVRTGTIFRECVCAGKIVQKPWTVTTMDVYEKS